MTWRQVEFSHLSLSSHFKTRCFIPSVSLVSILSFLVVFWLSKSTDKALEPNPLWEGAGNASPDSLALRRRFSPPCPQGGSFLFGWPLLQGDNGKHPVPHPEQPGGSAHTHLMTVCLFGS
jgi:hypothetical protein